MNGKTLAIDPLTSPPDADILLPGSKSITNRALVAAALARGVSKLRNVLIAEDTLAMIDCVRAMGVRVELDRRAAACTVYGSDGSLSGNAELFVRQSGTTARFVLPLAALASETVTVDGHDQIRARPQGDLLTALTGLGVRAEAIGSDGHLPVRISGPVRGGERVRVAAATSSQFVSGLLLSAPCIPGGLTIELTGPIVSSPYIEMTVDVMRSFGADVGVSGDRLYSVAGTGYQAADYAIEPDASTASYFFAAAAVSGGRVGIDGLGAGSIQGDARFLDVLESMGATVVRSATSSEVRGPMQLRGIELSMADISDTAPTLAAIAPFVRDPVRVTGIGFIRHKESDRIAAVVNELQRLGVDAIEEDDGFTVMPGAPGAGTVETYDDHRIAMAFTVLGLMTPGLAIADPFCVAKTFPEFFDTVDALRGVADAGLAVIALDGPAGSGKSTVARHAAERLGLEYLDTGAMYRSVTLAAIEAGLDLDDEQAVSDLARRIEIDVGGREVTLDGRDVTRAIRSEAVNAHVSQVAANPGVRAAMRRQQRAWARRRGGGVLEGRDIGSVVFPRARLKVYVTASLEERARRRSAESGVPMDELLATMQARDTKDSNREDSPLTEAADAVVVDTTGLSIDEVVERVVELFDGR